MRALIDRFFIDPLPTSMRIGYVPYDPEHVQSYQKLIAKNGIHFIKNRSKDVKYIWRGISPERYLGGFLRFDLGPTAMRRGLAYWLHSRGYTSIQQVSPQEQDQIIGVHTKGYSFTKQASTTNAHSGSYCSGVALGFGVSSAKQNNFPGTSLLLATPVHEGIPQWEVIYNKPDENGWDRGNSSFAYQREVLLPFPGLPMPHCVLINQESPKILHAKELVEFKSFDLELQNDQFGHILQTLFSQKYQELEIKKVIAYDDYYKYMTSTANPDESQASELYAIYKGIRKEQDKLLNTRYERTRWVEIANEVAPKTYNVIHCDDKGFTLELPAKEGKDLVVRVSNNEALIFFAPLFEMDPALVLEDVKNGLIPEALNYLAESVVRMNKELIDFHAVNNCVVDKKSSKFTPLTKISENHPALVSKAVDKKYSRQAKLNSLCVTMDDRVCG